MKDTKLQLFKYLFIYYVQKHVKTERQSLCRKR